jgi:hypothetical protein
MRLGRRRFGIFSTLALAALSRRVSAQETVEPEQLVPMLGAVARELFPHDHLPDTRYDQIAQAFVAVSHQSAQRLAVAVGGPYFATLARSDRVTALREQERSPDFQTFRMHVLMQIYGDLNITRSFGYEGPSLQKGGYLHRGFDELNWLPTPGADAN